MEDLTSVYILSHEYTTPAGWHENKFIGVYRTRGDAEAAIERLKSLPGFRDELAGFVIDAHVLNEEHWSEGFVSDAVDEESPQDAPPEAPATTHHPRPAPAGYWIYEVFRNGMSHGYTVGLEGETEPLASALTEAMAYEVASDD